MDSYFIRTGDTQYTATHLTSGAWNIHEQHISPALGLATHLVETHAATQAMTSATNPVNPATTSAPTPTNPPKVISRLSFDIFGVVPIGAFDYAVRTLRPGRTIELVEATLAHAGRTIVLARAWLMTPGDSSPVAGTTLPPLPTREQMTPYAPASDWQGDYLGTYEGYRLQHEPGRAQVWQRTHADLIDDAPTSPLVRAAGMFDVANGLTVRQNPTAVAFPNVDLTAHIFRQPDFAHLPGEPSDWQGYDVTVTFGPGGLGLTHAILHDATGPYASLAQSLTVRI